MKKMKAGRKLVIMAMFVSVGLVLQYVESRIIITPVPGGKLGLANIVSIINLFVLGGRNALIISVIRAFLGTIVSGGISALPYSLFGTFFSTLSMCILKKYVFPNASVVGMSVVGASVHNLIQIIVASVIFSSFYIFSYLPFLLIVSLISGTVTGYGAYIFLERIKMVTPYE